MTTTQTHITLNPLKQIASRTSILGLVSLFLPVAGLTPAMAAPASQVISLTWDDPNPETDVIGYKVHFGTKSGVYNQTLDTGNSSQASLVNLTPGQKYFCVVTAYNSSGVESDYSEEIAFIAISTDTTFTVSGMKIENAAGGDGAAGGTGGTSISMTVDGQLGTGTDIKVEASNDLDQWELISTQPNQSGTITFDDPAAEGQPQRFYRFIEN